MSLFRKDEMLIMVGNPFIIDYDKLILEETMRESKNIPISEKVCLTFEEMAEYSNIGENKLRELASRPNCPFVLINGNRRLIKRKKFEKFIEQTDCI